MLQKLIILLIVIFIPLGLNFAQFKDLSVEVGTIPVRVFGNNAITASLRETPEGGSLGGGFFGFQNSFALKSVWQVDSKGRFAIPFGVEWVFYRALYRIPYTSSVTFYIDHSIDVPTLTLGFRYNMFKLPFANVKAYTEFNARGAFVGKNNFRTRVEYLNYDSVHTANRSYKNGVFRLGGGLNFGFVGEIAHPWYVNILTGVSYVNLLFKNDARGELLTIVNTNELKENPVYNFYVGLLVQYRLGNE